MDQETKQKLHLLPTEKQLEMFYMLHQIKSQVYEVSTQNLGNVCLSNVSHNAQLDISEDQMSVFGTQGYRSALGTHGITKGTYYYECQFQHPKNISLDQPEYQPQVRVGFASPAARLDGPIGFDQFGYSLRSVDCSICHNRQRLFDSENTKSFAKMQISPNDIIGCLIHMPDFSPQHELPQEQELCESKSSVKITAKRMDEVLLPEQVTEKYQELTEVVPNSFIQFYVNGTLVAVINNIFYNRYYPAVSMYNYASVKVNFGLPNRICPGYPLDFHVLSPIIKDIHFNNEPGFGHRKLNLVEIINDEALQQSEATTANVTITESQPQSSPTNVLSSNIKESDPNILEIWSEITEKDCHRLGVKKAELRQFLKSIYHSQTEEVDTFDGLIEDYTEQEYQHKGFQFPPQLCFSPFSVLYKIRSETDYEKTISAIRNGYYNAQLHNEIMKLMKECNYDRKKNRK